MRIPVPLVRLAGVLLLPGALLAQEETQHPMSFFVTSESHSGNLGGLAGAGHLYCFATE